MDTFGRIGFSDEQRELQDVATAFCREKFSTDKSRALLSSEIGYDEAIWQEMVALGWTAIAIPERFGGVGLSLSEVTPVIEQIGRNFAHTPLHSSTIAAHALLFGATEEQCASILPKIVDGTVVSLALSEDDGMWDLETVSTTAKRDGEMIAISGVKRFVVDAEVANALIVSVSLDSAPALVIIHKSDLDKNALSRETVIDETKRSYRIRFDDIRIPSDQLMDIDKARTALHQIDLAANLLSSAEMVGGCQAVIDYTLDYLKTRKQFGKLIGSYQALKHPTVDAFLDYEQARSHLYSAAHCIGEQGVGEIAVRMAKAAADKAYSFSSDRSIQFHGGFGFTYDCDAQLHRRRAIWHASQYGDSLWQRQKLAQLIL